MSAINVMFAALFAAGAFAIFAGMTMPGEAPKLPGQEDVLTVAGLRGTGGVQRGVLARLQFMLDTARIDLNAAEFMLVSALLAGLGALGAYLLSNAPLAALLGLVAGASAYWFYLKGRAEGALEDYENALPQVLARLVAGARAGGTFVEAARYVVDFGPENCRADWQYILDQLGGGADLAPVFDHIVAKRGSLLLASIFELIVIQQKQGASLSKTFEEIQRAFRARVRVMRQARVSMKGPLKELWIVCAIPFLAVVALRLVAPGYAAIYGTLFGQLILLLGWGLVIFAFFLGQRSFSSGLRAETDFGALPPHPTRPAPPRPGDDEPDDLDLFNVDDLQPTLYDAQAAAGALEDLLD